MQKASHQGLAFLVAIAKKTTKEEKTVCSPENVVAVTDEEQVYEPTTPKEDGGSWQKNELVDPEEHKIGM